MKAKLQKIKDTPQFKNYSDNYDLMIQKRILTREASSENMFNYYINTVQIMDMMRKAILDLRSQSQSIIASEISKVNQEYAVGIFILVILFIISPMMIILVRNAVNAVQLFSVSVRVKAKALKKEKRKAEGLVTQMLPKSVAENLKQNKSTSEMFDSATICFTEIDGFKAIARCCSPLQLFDLLNTLYRTFDSRIDSFDVYKVETINDSYMVASGLPERNGDRHAAEIANLCIDLLYITPGILLSHDPTIRLKIRIGIHSGGTTAGVVGSKMPRYCLFGDAVNVASRMQSTGEPMKIHMTYETKMLLDNVGGYKAESRGQVEVKGKGLMDTYWLLARS